jgi:hypothetical protein
MRLVLVGKDVRSGDSNCPALYRTDTGDYVVVGRVIADTSDIRTGLAADEVAVLVPANVIEGTGHAALVRGPTSAVRWGTSRTVVELGSGADAYIVEATTETGAALVVASAANAEVVVRPVGARAVASDVEFADALGEMLVDWRKALVESMANPSTGPADDRATGSVTGTVADSAGSRPDAAGEAAAGGAA